MANFLFAVITDVTGGLRWLNVIIKICYFNY
jgi:hypothetical protein